MTWRPDQIDTLKTGWAAGHTASQIALELGDGFTRNAVIGKAHRLGLEARPARNVPSGRPSAAQRKKDGEVVGGIRKAYASRGDDTTLSRFVKVKGEHRTGPKQFRLPDIIRVRPAIAAGRTLFAKSVKRVDELPHLLVSGHSNVKIGRDVRKGWLRGYWIYTLSLEERATCPRTCLHWQTCYGNNMPWAKRVSHRDPVALMDAIERDVERLLAVRGRAGILVRLHALGDFFSVPYVWFWAKLLDKHPHLAVYGYTAYPHYTPIGAAIAAVKEHHGRRFAVRWSNGGHDEDCTVSIKSFEADAKGGIVCPEQTGATPACATCGLCWGTLRNIAFVEH